MILSVVLLGVCNVNVAKAESSITFTPVTSIKLGEELRGKFQYQNASQGMVPTIGFSEEDGNKFWLVGSGGPTPEFPPSGNVTYIFQLSDDGSTYCSEAINVGTVQAKCYATYRDFSDKKEPIVTYPVTIETPVITASANERHYVGDEIEFNTKLTNVALKEGNIEELKAIGNPNETGSFTYQAKTEIIEGQDLVVSENADYSNALSSTEKLTFKGTGTVKIKVTYTPVIFTWTGYYDSPTFGIDETGRDMREEIYKPETIITIKVAEAKETLNQQVTNVKSENLVEEKYTAETWKVFSVALAKAESVLAKENVTNEEYASAIEELKVARENLKAKEDNSSATNNSTTNNSTTNNSAQNDKKEETNTSPKTGDAVNVFFYLILCMASLVCIIGLKKRTA